MLDNLSYARRDQAETSVLVEPIGKRYERRSMLIKAQSQRGILIDAYSPSRSPCYGQPDRYYRLQSLTFG